MACRPRSRETRRRRGPRPRPRSCHPPGAALARIARCGRASEQPPPRRRATRERRQRVVELRACPRAARARRARARCAEAVVAQNGQPCWQLASPLLCSDAGVSWEMPSQTVIFPGLHGQACAGLRTAARPREPAGGRWSAPRTTRLLKMSGVKARFQRELIMLRWRPLCHFTRTDSHG
jgi:hypothetical protein